MFSATLVSLFLILFQAPAPPAAKPAQPPTPPAPGAPVKPDAPQAEGTPAAPAVVYDTGPLKAEITAMREIRLKYLDSAERSAQESNFAMQIRISGEKLGQIKRFGNFLLTEAVDDKGGAMIKDDTYNEQDKTTMRQQAMPIERLRESGLLIATRGVCSSRGATKIAKLKGSVKLVLAEKTETITILNPYQYVGKSIDDPRLKEMGLEIKVLPVEDIDQPLQAQRCIVLQPTAKKDNIQSVAFYDGGMQPMRHRESPASTKAKEDATSYCLDGGSFTNETSLVLEVHPQVEVVNLPLEAENVELP